MQPRKLLARVSRGDVQNVAFADFCRLVERFGFSKVQTAGSHRIYQRSAIPEQVNLQGVGGDAKASHVPTEGTPESRYLGRPRPRTSQFLPTPNTASSADRPHGRRICPGSPGWQRLDHAAIDRLWTAFSTGMNSGPRRTHCGGLQ